MHRHLFGAAMSMAPFALLNSVDVRGHHWAVQADLAPLSTTAADRFPQFTELVGRNATSTEPASRSFDH